MPVPESPASPRWRTAAACAGLPPQIVFARREAEARPALEACRRCPVARRCEESVAPAESYFDGVSAGRLWRNGRLVRLRGHYVAPSHVASEGSPADGPARPA
ncbi:WhiB family transcriptional regulator [Streptomyces sp. NPDC094448]|uniref:WhiB family transcriptional regulator n=1 Tax=Streptomyces sp. NPDC094448 TaxID=3366063 RepID=UPI00380FA154